MLVKLAFAHAKIGNISKKFFVMIDKDGGGTGQFLGFMGEHRAHGGPPSPPTRENHAL